MRAVLTQPKRDGGGSRGARSSKSLLFAALPLLVIATSVGCGSGGGGSAEAPEPLKPVARCLAGFGAEVTRERDERSSRYKEVVAVAPDQGLLRIYLIDTAEKAASLKQTVERELSDAAVESGLGLAYVDLRAGGTVMTVVTAPPGEGDEFSAEDLPSEKDQEIVRRCAAQ